MIKKIICSFFFLIIITKVNSQNNSNIRTIDLVFLPGINKPNPEKANDEGSEDFVVECLTMVKIEKIESVSKVQFLFGNSKNPSEILVVTGDVIEFKGNYFIQYKDKSSMFTNYTCTIKTDIPKTKLDKIKTVTFYLIDNLGRKTQELHFNVN